MTEIVAKHKYHRKTVKPSTRSYNLNISRLVLQLSLPNPLRPGIKSKRKMYLEQRPQATLQLHLSD